MVGKAELLFLLNDPKRSERDNERDSGLEAPGEDDGASAAFLSSSVVTNLSSSAKSASLFEVRLDERFSEDDVAIGSTSESCNNKG